MYDIYSYLPIKDPFWGKLQATDPVTNILHTCMPYCVMNGFHSADVNKDQLPPIECFLDCGTADSMVRVF